MKRTPALMTISYFLFGWLVIGSAVAQYSPRPVVIVPPPPPLSPPINFKLSQQFEIPRCDRCLEGTIKVYPGPGEQRHVSEEEQRAQQQKRKDEINKILQDGANALRERRYIDAIDLLEQGLNLINGESDSDYQRFNDFATLNLVEAQFREAVQRFETSDFDTAVNYFRKSLDRIKEKPNLPWQNYQTLTSDGLTQALIRLAQTHFAVGQWNEAVKVAEDLRIHRTEIGCAMLANFYSAVGLIPLELKMLSCATQDSSVQKRIEMLRQLGLAEFTSSNGRIRSEDQIPHDVLIKPTDPRRSADSDPWPSAFVFYQDSAFILYTTKRPQFSWLSEISNGETRVVRLLNSKDPEAELLRHIAKIKSVSTLYNKGEKFLHADRSVAKESLERVLSTDPEHYFARTALAEILLEESGADAQRQMEKILEPLIAVYPSWGLGARGQMYEKLGKINEARQDYLEAAMANAQPGFWSGVGHTLQRWRFGLMTWICEIFGYQQSAIEYSDKLATLGDTITPHIQLLKMEWSRFLNASAIEERLELIHEIQTTIRRIRLLAPDHLEALSHEIQMYIAMEVFAPATVALHSKHTHHDAMVRLAEYLRKIEHDHFSNVETRTLGNYTVLIYRNEARYPENSTIAFHTMEAVFYKAGEFSHAITLTRQRLSLKSKPGYFIDLYTAAGQKTLVSLGIKSLSTKDFINIIVPSVDGGKG